MRSSPSLQLYSIILLCLSTFTLAWPWPKWLPELDALIVRDNSNPSTTTAPAAATTNTVTSPTTGPTNKGTATTTGTKTSSGKETAGGSIPKNGNATTTTKNSHETLFDPELPAGGINLVTPAVIAGSQFYKIGDYVTFAWNYTNLLATPTAINVLATCTQNSQLYTIAANQSVANTTGSVVWDTRAYQSDDPENPLLTNQYTLIIYDAQSSISATAQAGYLAVYDQYVFGMYTPQAYTPYGEYKCVTCSGALSDMERRALGLAFGMSIITVLSFSWFVGGLGIIW